jgi:hypothetical protein
MGQLLVTPRECFRRAGGREVHWLESPLALYLRQLNIFFVLFFGSI